MKLHPRITFTLLLLGLSLLLSCGAKKPTGPTGIDAFLVTYQTAYEAHDREAILNHVDWPAVDEALRAFTKDYVYPYLGQVAIVSIEAVAYEPKPGDPQAVEGRAVVPSPKPTHRVVITFEPEVEYEDPERIDILVVAIDGEVKLCGWVYAD